MARKPPKGKSLAEVNPTLAKQWHPTKNGDLTPFDVSCGSNKKVWWKCAKGNDHEWEAQINARNRGTGCPICSNKIIVNSNCLATLNPQLAKEWHFSKNEDLTPFNVGLGSHKKVWWKCAKGDDHEWESKIQDRARGGGCPICSNKIIIKSNCLATLNPQLAREWHPTKNGNLKPDSVALRSGKKVWWKCEKGADHEWYISPDKRRQTGCPMCAGKNVVKSNCLSTTHPLIAKQWHPTKNGSLSPNDVTYGSNKKVWWKCNVANDHVYKSSISDRRRKGCPICAGKITVKSNSLTTIFPLIAKQWHPTKNGDLKPHDFTISARKSVWWKCDQGDDHEWKSAIYSRTKHQKCPICINQKIVKSNCLAALNPDLARQWHPIKNSNITPNDIGVGTSKRFWWICDINNDHEWKTSVHNRNIGIGCPYCTLTPQSKQELTITFELLQFFKGINPKGFKTRAEGKLWSIDIYIPELNLGIEFDGSYWHKDKRQLDKLKTKQLQKEGFEIVRVRQKPLKRIFKTDVMVAEKFDGKKVTNDVLLQIMKMYKLDGRKKRAMQNYIAKEELQNQKALDKYIDQILTEKAERKK